MRHHSVLLPLQMPEIHKSKDPKDRYTKVSTSTMDIQTIVTYCLLLAACLVSQTVSYQQHQAKRIFQNESSLQYRRDFISRLTRVAVTAAVAGGTAAKPALAAPTAVLSSQYCASGVGAGCEELSEGNELIKSLQAKSAANRESNAKVSAL